MKRTADISDFLKPIREKPYQAYLSNALQVADVLDWVLQQLGKSEVWQTSFSVADLVLNQRGVHSPIVLHREVRPRHSVQPRTRPQGHQQDAQTMGVHHAGYHHHLPCRQPQQGAAGAQRARRSGEHYYIAEPNARQPL